MPIKITHTEILDKLKSLANPQNVAGMARYGINPRNALGISMPTLRQITRETGKDHELASLLWTSGLHEARILASLVDLPSLVTESQMDQWVDDFDSWDICDQCCSNLFASTPLAFQKALEWSTNEKDFIKRAGFSMMACLAVKGKKANDRQFEVLFVNIKLGATDNRNMVKKAVNWALRQIGKRNPVLNQRAIVVAEEIRKMDSSSARWIASGALRELNSTAVQTRLKSRS